jgi:hypothetical protein
MFSKAFSISHIPVSARSETRYSIFFNIVISLLPLIIAFVVLAFPTETHDTRAVQDRLMDSLQTVFLSGQMYFFAMSVCATVVARDGLSSVKWMRLWSIAFVLFCVAFMVIYITQNPTSKPMFGYHSVLSWIFFLLALFIQYRVTLITEQPPPPPEEVNREDANRVAQGAEPKYD